ncbi:hypothetical protein CR163_002885 [Prosthecochloris sp. ZM_2]|uniref:hypothetical protein n=1 Tax=Prosthecochloris sp. ZM_2 TaxID=2045206 RepID=UPI000DF82E56|nr:hypothetical protein [Prosthecochloris sp. ZM_2]RNA64282.1 hypothetical protein CR163_002885 [Prosthecochloris sp. ZM_2]
MTVFRRFLAALAAFGVLLVTIYVLHSWYFNVNVVFYSALFDALLASAVVSVLLFTSRFFSVFTGFEKVQTMIILVLLGYVFAISVPTVLDRSLSFYIIEKLQQRGGAIAEQEMEAVFTQEYVKEHRLVDVRLTEQIESGTITVEDGMVRLTPFGRQLAGFSRFFRLHFLPKQRLLRGEYTDELTDPFRDETGRQSGYGEQEQ